jgi:hypothetical protein
MSIVKQGECAEWWLAAIKWPMTSWEIFLLVSGSFARRNMGASDAEDYTTCIPNITFSIFILRHAYRREGIISEVEWYMRTTGVQFTDVRPKRYGDQNFYRHHLYRVPPAIHNFRSGHIHLPFLRHHILTSWMWPFRSIVVSEEGRGGQRRS